MPRENVSPHDEQIPESEYLADLREIRFRKIVTSLPEPAYEAVATLSSILLSEDIEERLKAHSEHGDYERRVLIHEFRKVNMKKRQIRFVFRHYGLKVPKNGLKNR